MQRFGEKLYRLRKQRGMTISEVAQALGYAAHSHISEIENGKRAPSLKFAVKVAQLFKVTTDQLLNDLIELPTDPLAAGDRDV
jgi:XRE family transcriptional regulator, master regulator for biofilm formation